LDRDQIAAAALAVVDAKGVSGFTIRAIAQVMGVTPMALYHHVKNKADLARLVVSAAIKERPLAPLTGVWRDDMLVVARWSRQEVMRHPALGALHRVYPVNTPEIIAVAERWLHLWQQSGLDLRSAVRAAAASRIAIAGYAAEASALRNQKPPGEDSAGPNAHVRMTFELEDPEATFDLAMRSLIDGLHFTLSKESGKRPRSRRGVKKRKRPSTS
jgi:AcrR family transcriptional regulator